MSSILPVIEIDEDDPRYAELKRIEHEARIRFGKSEQARREYADLMDPNRERPDWRLASVVRKPKLKVFRWD